jgi:hypothetical protein
MRTGLARIICAAIVAFLTLAPSQASAAERKFPVAAGTLVVQVDPNWDNATDIPEELEGAVGFVLGDGTMMRWLMLPGNDMPPGSESSSDLRMMTNDLRRGLEKHSFDVSPDLISIEGPYVRGYYIRASNPNRTARGYRYVYTGFIAVNNFPVLFNIAWNSGGQGAADRAIAAVKNLRVR